MTGYFLPQQNKKKKRIIQRWKKNTKSNWKIEDYSFEMKKVIDQ